MQKVIPAILTSDPEELRKQLNIFKGHTNWVHIDIMDGEFVPNDSVSIFELGQAYEYFNLELHLMVKDPAKYFKDCEEIGAKRVIFHAEAVVNPQEILSRKKDFKFHLGMAFNPGTPIAGIEAHKELDSILLMGIHPGFQGQEFIPSVLEKIKEARTLAPDLLIGVDGGVGSEHLKQVFDEGASYTVIGSTVMTSEDPVGTLRKLQVMVS